MTVDWIVAERVGESIVLLFIGAWVTRSYESRPKLISYFGHVGSLQITVGDGSKLRVHTHVVVIRNVGRKSAANVRIKHHRLPDFELFPLMHYTVNDLPNGGKEIVIPNLVPKAQVTVSYLYYPPLGYEQIGAGIQSDEGFAEPITALLQQQSPKWQIWLISAMALIGLMTALYLGFVIVEWIRR